MAVSKAVPRIAILGLNVESNAWAPAVGRREFTEVCYLEGEAIARDLARPNPRCPAEVSGFVDRMSERGPWTPVYLFVAAIGGAGPVEQAFFDELMAKTEAGLAAAQPLDGVYIAGHGAGQSTGDADMDGTWFAAIRKAVGPGVPVVATLDLHAIVSPAMVAATDLLCAYLTNPHVDMYARGAEAADAMVALLAGLRTAKAHIRVPILPPQTALLTARGPYAEAVAMGQAMLGPDILNVSVCGNFSYADSWRSGIGVVVTSRGDQAAANRVAAAIAARIWADRERYVARLTPLEEAVQRMLAVCRDPSLPALAFADVADNPGGGAMGNTPHILRAFHAAGVTGVALGVFTDPALAAEAHALGLGARFTARFNRAPVNEFAEPFAAEAEVVALSDGRIVGRRGLGAGRSIDMGPSARLRLGGIEVVVISVRMQMFDPVQLEHFGIDIARLRGCIIKSRGHFRAGFDEFFPDDRIVEVDAPGMVTPVLTRVPFRNLARPIFPFDPDMEWAPPAASPSGPQA